MAAPPPPPPIKLAGGKLATPLPQPSAQVTQPDVPRAPAAPPSMLLTELAADGTLTPAVVYACWLRMFPGCPRTVPRREGEAFARALGADRSMSAAAVGKVIHCGASRSAHPYLCFVDLFGGPSAELCADSFRIVDVLLALRGFLPAGEVMPMPLATAEEGV